MKVKIVKYSKEYCWYKDRIGCVFEVIEDEINPLCFRNKNAHNCILKSDTIPVNEIKYELKSNVRCDTCVTSCKHKKNTMVGSVGCSKCVYNCGRDMETQTVQCSWQKESKEMKRLDVRKDLKSEKGIVVHCNSDIETVVKLLNDKADVITTILIGKRGVSLKMANDIIKLFNIPYELYESTNWSKVEEGTEVRVNGYIAKFHSYVPKLNKVIVIFGESVNAVDEDKVELV